MTDAAVRLWGTEIGAVSWLADSQIGVFQYTPEFVRSGIEPAPLMMPLSPDPYSFPALSKETFKGLPGMLADSLPDKFGNQLIDAWLVSQGRSPGSFNPAERLCYIGTRGMGALEFHPTIGTQRSRSKALEVSELVRLANRVLDERARLMGSIASNDDDGAALEDILRVGTSAGGARAKAVLAWNEKTGEFRSGQLDLGAGFTQWLIKFDGVHANADKELADPRGFGKIEYAYYLMAKDAGIEMERCRLHHENGRSHFMTRRFDRTDGGEKLHMQSLTALMHYDFNVAGAYSYEQAVQVLRQLDVPHKDVEQQVLRAAFNILARNQDDHVKNIAYLMDRSGGWRLSPAFDVSYSYNPSGEWTGSHQMSLNGKRDGFEKQDLLAFCASAGLKPARGMRLIRHITSAIEGWPQYASDAGVAQADADRIAKTFRPII
ncbi:MAG: type II toxin-antitoxin system HipA family toxin [Devosia sp.]